MDKRVRSSWHEVERLNIHDEIDLLIVNTGHLFGKAADDECVADAAGQGLAGAGTALQGHEAVSRGKRLAAAEEPVRQLVNEMDATVSVTADGQVAYVVSGGRLFVVGIPPHKD